MWEPRRLTTLWGSKTCYRDSFTCTFLGVRILSQHSDQPAGWMTGEWMVRFLAGSKVIIFPTASRPALCTFWRHIEWALSVISLEWSLPLMKLQHIELCFYPQLPIQWVPGAVSLAVYLQGCECDHSPPSSAEVKNIAAIPPLPGGTR
jgi:hypothetical protein